jgi:hypothetical protein
LRAATAKIVETGYTTAASAAATTAAASTEAGHTATAAEAWVHSRRHLTHGSASHLATHLILHQHHHQLHHHLHHLHHGIAAHRGHSALTEASELIALDINIHVLSPRPLRSYLMSYC